eukprot:365984-Chlamydomonas_euryale.AAC.9
MECWECWPGRQLTLGGFWSTPGRPHTCLTDTKSSRPHSPSSRTVHPAVPTPASPAEFCRPHIPSTRTGQGAHPAAPTPASPTGSSPGPTRRARARGQIDPHDAALERVRNPAAGRGVKGWGVFPEAGQQPQNGWGGGSSHPTRGGVFPGREAGEGGRRWAWRRWQRAASGCLTHLAEDRAALAYAESGVCGLGNHARYTAGRKHTVHSGKNTVQNGGKTVHSGITRCTVVKTQNTAGKRGAQRENTEHNGKNAIKRSGKHARGPQLACVLSQLPPLPAITPQWHCNPIHISSREPPGPALRCA